MKVLNVTSSYYPAIKYGGPIQSIHLLNKALVRKGIRVDVITTNAGLDGREDVSLNSWVSVDGVRVMYLKYIGHEKYTFSPSLLIKALRLTSDYDIVHVSPVWNFTVLAGSLASILGGKPYVLSPRGTLYPETISFGTSWAKKTYLNIIAKHYLKRAVLHFTAEDEREKVMEFIGLDCRSFVIPNGINVSEFNNLPSKKSFICRYPDMSDKKYVLFLGRIDPKKGLDILIDAFYKLSVDYNNLYLVVAGPDNSGYGREIHGCIQRYGLDRKVIFTGMLTGYDKLSAFVDAEMFVLPSYSENFGMAVAEAMACGCPVVISDKVGIYREIEENNAGIIVQTSADSVYNGIKKLLDDNDLRRRIAENGKQMVMKYYDIDKVSGRMIEIYERIISKQYG